MKLGGRYCFTEVWAKQLDQFAEAAGLSKAQTRKRLLHMAMSLPDAAHRLQAEPTFSGSAV